MSVGERTRPLGSRHHSGRLVLSLSQNSIYEKDEFGCMGASSPGRLLLPLKERLAALIADKTVKVPYLRLALW